MGYPYKQPYKHVMHKAIYCNDDEDAAVKSLCTVALVYTQTPEAVEW